MKVYELLNSKDKWIQSHSAKDNQGDIVCPQSGLAVKWCLMGAVEHCYGKLKYQFADRIRNYIKEYPTTYNDTHSYEDVINLCKTLDI